MQEVGTVVNGEVLAALLIALGYVVFLAAGGEAITEFFILPLCERFGLDSFWNRYIGAGVTFVLIIVSGHNLFAIFLPDSLALVWLGRVLTAILAGRGSNWIHEFFTNRLKQSEEAKAARAAQDALRVYYTKRTQAATIARGHQPTAEPD